VAEAKHRLAAVLRERSQLDSRAALAGRLEEDRKALADALRTIEEVKLSEKGAAESWTTAEAAHGVAVEAAAKASLRLAALRSDIEALRPWLAKCEPLAGAKSRLEELRPQEERLSEDVAALTERLSEPPPSAPEVGPNVAALQATSDAAAQSLSDALRDVGAWEGRLSLALRSQEAVGALRGELGGVRTEQADWTRLGLDLGRDGLQAALIDAAVPELGELTNDLLRATVGARWTVTFETQRASSDGKKLIEGLEVRVIDTEAGREGEASTLSGGEATLLGEAVSLALAMLACRRSGEVGPTIVRDESGAALDPEKRPHYVAMLRRAADIVGASRVLIVSHSEDVVSLCDAVVEVGGGK
jgi:exonuclease SbcC